MIERRDLLAALALSPIAGAAGAAPGEAAPASSAQPALGRAVAEAITDIRGSGARSDGNADDAEPIVRAAGRGSVVFPQGVTRIGRSLVVRAPAEALQGAVIRLDPGVTVTFAGGFRAPLAHVFQGDGRVAFDPAMQSTGHPEWWGARAGDQAVDCAGAINACIEACPVTQLQQGRYHVRRPVRLPRGGRTLRGVNEDQNPDAPSTQIMVDDPTIPGLICGTEATSKPASTDMLTLENFAVARTRPAAAPLGLDSAPAGVKFLWCALVHATRVTARDHAVGFYLFGCVECYFHQCSAIRYEPGERPAQSPTCGFFLDYGASLGLAGGNASLYFSQCRAFTDGKTDYLYSAGMATRGGFVDLFVTQLETGFQKFGIDLQGDGFGSDSYSTQDCHIKDCVLDSNAVAGIRIRNAGRHCDVHVSGCYVALGGATASSACMVLGGQGAGDGVAGPVTVSNCEFIGDFGGVVATNVATCTLALNTYLNLERPIAFQRVRDGEIRDIARILRVPEAPGPAVALAGCEGMIVQMSVSGSPGGFRGGVSIDAASTRIEVNCTRLDPHACSGAERRILQSGAPWGGGAAFGTRNLATGIL